MESVSTRPSRRVRIGYHKCRHATRRDGAHIPHEEGGREIAQSSPHDTRAESALLLLKRLAGALHTCRLYGTGHARTRNAVAGLAVAAARGAGTDGALTVEVTRTAWRLPRDGHERAAGPIAPLLHALYGRGISAVSFAAGVADAEFRELLAILDLPIEHVRVAGGPAEALRARGVALITVRELAAATPGGPPDASTVRRSAEAVLRRFVAAAKHVRLYGDRHRIVQAALDDLFAALRPVLAASGGLRYDVRSGTVFAGDAPLDGDRVIAAAFAADCAARRIDRLTFAWGLTRAELAQAVALFALEPEALIVEGGFPEALRARQVAHVG